MIPYGHQSLDESDIDAVADVLRSDWLTQGPMAPRFGRAVADYCGAAYGVAMSSATAGLHLACLALGLGPGERLWSSPISFVASANCGRYCGRYCGAEVDFVDVEPAS
ncbi:spore coat protein, partial [Candidatus Endoriftia persephone str. Guaymas]|nr:spore coat protein [Candidatus Endoriftia persephone str. Guaymas]